MYWSRADRPSPPPLFVIMRKIRLRMRREVIEPRWGRMWGVGGLPASSARPTAAGCWGALMAAIHETEVGEDGQPSIQKSIRVLLVNGLTEREDDHVFTAGRFAVLGML